jgi:ACS family hexuronate transporter-like MFS transporter
MRFFLGLGEAVNFPAAIKAVTEWFPKKERALATGCSIPGPTSRRAHPGPGPLAGGQLRLAVGVHPGGNINFIFVAFWWPLNRRPQDKKGLDPAELKHILSDNDGDENAKIPWRQLLGYARRGPSWSASS